MEFRIVPKTYIGESWEGEGHRYEVVLKELDADGERTAENDPMPTRIDTVPIGWFANDESGDTYKYSTGDEVAVPDDPQFNIDPNTIPVGARFNKRETVGHVPVDLSAEQLENQTGAENQNR